MSSSLRFLSLPLMLAVLLAQGAAHAQNKVDYWALMAPVLAGQYGDGCAVTGIKDMVPSPYTVSRDGLIEAVGQRADFRLAKSFSIQAKREPRARYLSVAATFDDHTASITTVSQPQETRATLLREAMQVRCHSAKTAAHMAAATPHLLIAPFLGARSKVVACAAAGGHAPKTVRYGYADGQLTVGPHVISLRDAVEEVLYFEQGYKAPDYSARGPGMASSVLVGLDNHGAIVKLSYPAKKGGIESCDVLPGTAK